MPATLIVSANPARARIFMQGNGCGTFEEIHDMASPAGNEQGAETDKLVRCLAGYVKQAHDARMFDDLILVASPEVLGEIKKRLHPPLDSAVSLEIGEDFTRLGAEQLCERIRQRQAH